MKTLRFYSFDNLKTGRVITHFCNYAIVLSRNPYGSHNLVLVDQDSGEAIRHGNAAVIEFAYNWLGKHAYRKAARVAAKRGLRWSF